MCTFCYSLFLLISNVLTTFLQKLAHLRCKENYSAFQYVASSINLIDFTWGIYLTFLVLSDFIFEDNFVIQESLFKSSFACFFLLSINLNFNILSPLLSGLMSFSKFMVVIFLLIQTSKTKNLYLTAAF